MSSTFPPPTREQLCNRYCSNTHTRSSRPYHSQQLLSGMLTAANGRGSHSSISRVTVSPTRTKNSRCLLWLDSHKACADLNLVGVEAQVGCVYFYMGAHMMMMPFICSYRNKNERLTEGRAARPFFPSGARPASAPARARATRLTTSSHHHHSLQQ